MTPQAHNRINRLAEGEGGAKPATTRRRGGSGNKPPPIFPTFNEGGRETFLRPRGSDYEWESVYETEEHTDLLTGMMAAAVRESRMRSAAVRAQLKRTLRGPALAAALAAAKALARADLAGARAAIRRNFGQLRGSKRRKRSGGLMTPKSG